VVSSVVTAPVPVQEPVVISSVITTPEVPTVVQEPTITSGSELKEELTVVTEPRTLLKNRKRKSTIGKSSKTSSKKTS
jgi:hypothetical protein